MSHRHPPTATPIDSFFSGSPDGLGSPSSPTRKTEGPGSGLEWVPKYRLGDADSDSIAILALRGLINGGVGAIVGIALAPSHDKRTKYGITGGVLGLFLGPLGIGGQALYVLSKD